MTARARRERAARRAPVALLAAAAALAAAGLPVGARDAAPPVASGGETLTYDLLLEAPALGRMKLGELVLRVVEDGPEKDAASSLVEMRMRSTNAMLETLFPVRERWLSMVDRSGLFSRGYELTRRHRSEERTDKQTFDYTANVGRWSRKEQDGRVKSGELGLPGPVQDNVSWLYHVRGRLAAGERSIGFVTAERDHLRPAEIAVIGEEELDLGAFGRVRALRTTAEVGIGGLGAQEERVAAGESLAGEPSLLWFEAETGVLVKARIVSDYGLAELLLRERKGVAAGGGRGRGESRE